MPKQTNDRNPERIAAQSPDLRTDLRARLRDLVPEAFAEGKLDADKLKALLGENGDAGAERYSFSWAGKRDAMSMLQVPTRATLVPDRANSVNFDEAQHVFIEGENLEVLKVLYRSYFGRVKMIYIDPPYNTGNDFIYPDDFADPLDHYLRITGQKNGNGDYNTSQVDKNGRIHSAWLSMMYPRLALARQLLREDGFIAVSIDNNELHHLRLAMNELFGAENFLSTLVWEKTRKNDSRFFSNGHDYIVIYARNEAYLRETDVHLREAKPGAKEIQDEYLRLRKIHQNDDAAVQVGIREFYKNLPQGHPAKKHSRYGNVDKKGVWRDDNMSWPGGGGPTYDVPHPKTGKACAVPEGGWRYSTYEKMQEMIEGGIVVFRDDHTNPPIRKTYLVRTETPSENGDSIEDEADDVGIQVMGSYFYRSALRASRTVTDLLGGKVFDNPKDHEVLARLIRYLTGPTDIVLDYFGGAASTAHAVQIINEQDGTKRKSVVVQLPEPVPPKSPAAQRGFGTISDIARERIRRVLSGGFRAFHLAPSNVRSWTGVAEKDVDILATQIEAFADSFVPGWTPENVIWETALREGYSLTSRIEKIANTGKQNFWRVTDPEREQSFVICLDDTLTLDAMRALKLRKESLFVCRDAALDDTLSANLALQCRLKVL
jgi:adenine-specific DNA-methyltransferase